MVCMKIVALIVQGVPKATATEASAAPSSPNTDRQTGTANRIELPLKMPWVMVVSLALSLIFGTNQRLKRMDKIDRLHNNSTGSKASVNPLA